MINNAKVSLAAVTKFKQSVAAIKDHSPKFESGISCFDSFDHLICQQRETLYRSIDNMQSSLNKLEKKIKSTESDIANANRRLNTLEEHLSSLENELLYTLPSVTMYDENNNSYEMTNPEYEELEEEISSTEEDIDTVNDELMDLNEELENSNTLRNDIKSKIDEINAVIYSLGEKRDACRRLSTELTEIKIANHRNSTIAADGLKRITDIINTYTHIKMKYDASSISGPGIISGRTSNIDVDINVTINKTSSMDKIKKSTEALSREEIIEHNIKFDANGKISSYDNKSFGGKYNTYEERLIRTSSDTNPMLGHYEGERGESKYIPSARTADGLTVIEILKEYGLDGITYMNAEPDFEPCSEAVVKIKSMTGNREDNFPQADIACAELWNSIKYNGKDDWCGRDVLDYRKANDLTWHEKCDTETMVLVRREINAFFKHSGGCAECNHRDNTDNGGGFDE